MRILCKEKDFYDYVGFGENGSEDVTFDRRKMWMIKRESDAYDESTIYHVIDSLMKSRGEKQLTEKVIGVFIGYTLYIIKLTSEPRKFSFDNGIEPFKYSAELIAARKCYDIKHSLPIEFVEFGIFNPWNLKSFSKDLTKDYKEGNIANWEIKPAFKNIEDRIPILKNTFIPKLIDAKEVYYNIEEWLISQHNDVDQESIGLTDVDKAINHGFDKKTSFRKM